MMDEHLSWDALYPFMDEVKAMARGLLRHEHQASLQTTALVLTALRRQRHADQDWSRVSWANRQYFFGAMYRAMERALLDHARVRARRRETPVRPEDLLVDNLPQALVQEPAQVVALVEALAELKQVEPQWVTAIEHRFYGGLTLEETARMMAVDERTLRRWWDRARPLLYQRIVQRMNAEPPGLASSPVAPTGPREPEHT
jgi:DNA-directed RNA polymerase specialized sigma24 family protein